MRGASGTTTSVRKATKSASESFSSCCVTPAATVGDELVSIVPDGLEAQADWSNLQSPETYLGYRRAQNFATPDDAELIRLRPTPCPSG